MRVLLLTADLGGNVPPTLAVAEALARRGAEVEVAGLEPGRIALPQVSFAPAAAIGAQQGKRGMQKAGPLLRLMAGRSTARAAATLVAERRPAVVVVDCMTPAPLRGALESGLPVVVLFHTLGAFWTGPFDRGPAGRLFGMLGMRPRTLWDRAAARLLLTDRDIDPSRDDPSLAGYDWTGTTEMGTAERSPRGSRPRVLVALSSTDWPGMLPVYRRIVSALSTLRVEAIVTTGGVDLGGELAGAANVEVRGWVPHAEVLPAVDLVVGHGGHSTTMKALAHGVPLLILPINPTADQGYIGETIQSAGLGAWLPKTASAERIRAAVHAILDDGALRRRATAIGERLRAARPGADVAAELVLAVRRRES